MAELNENESPVNTPGVDEKLVSSQKHAKQALEVTTRAAKAAFEASKEHATVAFKEGKEHVTAAAQDLTHAATAKVEEVRTQVGTVAQTYKGRAEQVFNDASIRARTFQDDGESYIRENPLRAVGIAVGVGFVLGLLIRR